MLPKEYRSGSTCHRRFQQWNSCDIFKKGWIRLLKIYDDLIGINWTCQSIIDSIISIHDIRQVTSVVDNAAIHKRLSSYKTKKTVRERRRRKLQHLCLDKAYNSEPEERELIKRGYVLHIPPNRKRDETDKEEHEEIKIIPQHCSNRKKHSAKRWWVVERTNSWHNRFRKLLTRYEKKVENYLGLVQLSCCMIIYRKIILG
jgi:transposase